MRHLMIQVSLLTLLAWSVVLPVHCGITVLGPVPLGGSEISLDTSRDDYSASSDEGVITTSSNAGDNSGYNYSPAPVIMKHVYVHVAPEEQQVERQSRIFVPSPPLTKYKIVFIKAPSQPSPVGAHIQLPQQDEEKTVIYILTKKQDQQAEINIHDAKPTKPSKPEVYFIRYKTQKSSGGSYGLPDHGDVTSAYGAPSASS